MTISLCWLALRRLTVPPYLNQVRTAYRTNGKPTESFAVNVKSVVSGKVLCKVQQAEYDQWISGDPAKNDLNKNRGKIEKNRISGPPGHGRNNGG